MNIRYFSEKIRIIDILKICSIASIPILVYFWLAIGNIDLINYKFYHGIIPIIGSSSVLAMTLFATNVFRNGLIEISWALLAIGIFLSSIGDVWYYYLEFLGEYSTTHELNLFWYVSSWVIVHSLIKHKQII